MSTLPTLRGKFKSASANLEKIHMKHLKSCAAAVLALLAADAAFAQTTIRITGSTAFRSATIASVKNLLQPGFDQAYTGTSASGFQYGTFVGLGNTASGLNGQALVIQCAWTGSVEGIRDVSQGLTQPFIKADYVTTTTPIDNVSTNLASTYGSSLAVYENAIPDVTLADNVQAITLFPSPALKEARVGVIPFVWVKGRVLAPVGGNLGHPAYTSFTNNLTNITNQLAQTLLSGGANLSLLTGVTADVGTKIYAFGRNPLSGTRVVTFTEMGFGTNTPTVQFQPTLTYLPDPVTGLLTLVDPATRGLTGDTTTGPTTGTITEITPSNEDTLNGFDVGNNGYSSGGTLVDELGRTVTDITGAGNPLDGVPFGLVGYVGVSDAARLLKNINTSLTTNVSYVLSYNGVSLNPVYTAGTTQTTAWDFTPVKEGKYSFWSYVYIGYRNVSGPQSTVALAGNAKTFADNLTSNIITTLPSSSGIKLSDMKVQRSSEGAPITSL